MNYVLLAAKDSVTGYPYALTATGGLLNVSSSSGGSSSVDLTTTNALITSANADLALLDTAVGNPTDTSASSDSGTFSLIAQFKRGLATLTSILTACQSATPAGANKIGTVDQATSSTPFTVKDHNSASSGSTFFNDTTARTGTWYSIQFLAATVFTTLTDSTRDGASVSSFSFSAGTVIYGNFTAITLASGSAIAYKA